MKFHLKPNMKLNYIIKFEIEFKFFNLNFITDIDINTRTC